MVIQVVLIFACFSLTNAETFYIVTSQETPCPGEFSGVPCVSLQHYVSNPSINTGNVTLLFQTGNHTLATAFSASSASSYTLAGEDVNIECVSSAAQWNFLSIQQVHMRGISFFRCHGGMTFRNMEVFTMKTVEVQNSTANNSPFTITNVAQVNIIGSTFSNNNNYNNRFGGVFNVRNSSIEISSSMFHNNYAYYCGGVLYVNDNNLRGTNQNRITITNSIFANNRAGRLYYGKGGAIYISHSRDSYRYHSVVLSISSSSFHNNKGGSVYYDGDEELFMTHSIFTTNYNASICGGAVYSR